MPSTSHGSPENRSSQGHVLELTALLLFFVPACHPLLIPLVGVPSHLLWWSHVFSAAVVAYRYGRYGSVAVVSLSAIAVVAGERLFGHGYGSPAGWETVAALATALTVTNVLVVGFAIYARRAAARLHEYAYRDRLTGLPNRRYLEAILHDPASRGKGSRALLFVDLDDFKTINDTLGHTVGDIILVAFVKRLMSCLRPVDIVARWAGDEFVILLHDLPAPETATKLAQRIHDSLNRPIAVQDVSISIQASIGIAIGESHEPPETLLREADTAVYEAKARGHGNYQLFDRQMHKAATNRFTILNGLKRAIEHGEIINHYQPIHDTRDNQILGVEALARWQDPDKGLVSPDNFIPLAESSGLIVDVGRRGIEVALADVASWQRQGLLCADFFLNINVSPVELRDPEFESGIRDACQRHGIEPSGIVLEITESALMDKELCSLNALEKLRSLNMRLAIDDFGSGYSSLAYLHRLPADILKIDREIVSQLTSGEAQIVKPIVEIAAALNLEVIAEGVENEYQVRHLDHLGVTRLQGFGLSRPAPAGAVTDMLRRQFTRRGCPKPSPALRPIQSREAETATD